MLFCILSLLRIESGSSTTGILISFITADRSFAATTFKDPLGGAGELNSGLILPACLYSIPGRLERLGNP